MGFMIAKDSVEVDGKTYYKIIFVDPIPKGLRAVGARGYGTKQEGAFDERRRFRS